MKKSLLLILSVLILSAVIITGCSVRANKEIQQVPLRITAVLPHRDYGYWSEIADALISGKENQNVDIKICLPQLNYNIPQMVELIYTAAASQVDAIVVQGIEDDSYIEALEKAYAKGIQIVFIDTDLPEFPSHLYVGTDNYAAGRLMAAKMVKTTGEQARVAVVSGAPGYPNLDLRLKGIKDYLQRYPEIEIVLTAYNDYDSITMIDKFNEICSSPSEVDTILCIEGTGALALSNVGVKRPEQIRCIIGFDLAAEGRLAIQSGVLDGVIVQDMGAMGQFAVKNIVEFAQTGQYSDNLIYTPVIFVDKTALNEEAE